MKEIGNTIQPEREVISAGDIDATGISFILEGTDIRTNTGDFGEFYSIEIQLLKDGKSIPAVLNSSGKRLISLLKGQWPKILRQKLLLQGFKDGFERYYTLSLIEG